MLGRPPITLPASFRARLDDYRAGFADQLEAIVRDLRRPCVYLKSRRASDEPLRRSKLTKLFGKSESRPVLPLTVSKFGGTPYAESDESWDGWQFLGQIDLLEATAETPQLSLSGLLRIDASTETLGDGFRVRWFRDPSEAKAIVQPALKSVGSWEATIEFKAGWSLPKTDRDWSSLLPKELDDLRDFWNEWEPDGFNEDSEDDFHRMLGWPSSGLDQNYGFEPPAGCGHEIADYEMLLCLTYDNRAGFQWGTNWVYLLVPKTDFESGDLSRVVVTGANS